jgi:hypothetical protein
MWRFENVPLRAESPIGESVLMQYDPFQRRFVSDKIQLYSTKGYRVRNTELFEIFTTRFELNTTETT